ncbi:hypothetical protein JCM21900_002171 [Sporobolomyces salmonicolor]
MLARQSLVAPLRLASRRTSTAAFSSSVRALSPAALHSSEGMPSGKGQDSFNKREKAQEEAYVRDAEKEKLKALKKSIEASKAHLDKLHEDAKNLEASINGGGKQQ